MSQTDTNNSLYPFPDFAGSRDCVYSGFTLVFLEKRPFSILGQLFELLLMPDSWGRKAQFSLQSQTQNNHTYLLAQTKRLFSPGEYDDSCRACGICHKVWDIVRDKGDICLLDKRSICWKICTMSLEWCVLHGQPVKKRKESKQQQEKWKEMLNRPSTTYLDKKIAMLLKLRRNRPGQRVHFCATCLKDTIGVGLILMVLYSSTFCP